MTPAEELTAAAAALRQPHPGAAITATPTMAALLRAREPLAQWLESEARYWANVYIGQPMPDRDHYALAAAQAINGSPS